MKWQSALIILGAIASQATAGKDTVKCGDAKSDAGTMWIENGIRYIRGLSGTPVARAGQCNRVSCSYNSGIWVCSDDGKNHPLKSYNTVADVTQKIVSQCNHDGLVKGRLYSSDGWGVVVQGAKC